MDSDVFDKRFKRAVNRIASEGEGPDGLVATPRAALDIHSEILLEHEKRLQKRGHVSELEEREIDAFQQAIECYHMLTDFAACERLWNISMIALDENLTDEEMDRSSEVAIDCFDKQCALDQFLGEIEHVLTQLGLPTTLDDFEGYDGNRCRIQINPLLANPVPSGEFYRFCTHWSQIIHKPGGFEFSEH